MIGATLFSGIGAPEVAMPEWQWPWHAEIESFPSAVMSVRHPQSINLGDVTADDFCECAARISVPDVLVFGSPCQDFSVAGKRLGLDGARGNLALIALGIVDRLKPRWFAFENVPGLLSNWSGSQDCPPEPGSTWEGDENHDFAAFLGAVDEIGYSGCWAVLDAQYRGLAQRRERLFFVGYSGDWRGPAAVLLEPESLCGNSPPSREAGQGIAHDVAPCLGASGRGLERAGETRGQDPVVAVSPPIDILPTAYRCLACQHVFEDRHATGSATLGPAECPRCGEEKNIATVGPLAFGGNNTAGPIDVVTAVRAKGGTGHGDFESETFVAFVPEVADPISANEQKTYTNEGDHNFRCRNVVAFDTTQVTNKDNRSNPQPGDPCHPLAAGARAPTIAFQTRGSNLDVGHDVIGTIGSNADRASGSAPCIAFSCKDHGADAGDVAPTLRGMNEGDGNANAGGQIAVAFKPPHYTRDKDGAPSEIFPPLSADADKGDQDPVVLCQNGRGAVAFQERGRSDGRNLEVGGDVA